ncbi:MAG: DNA recombination protein RmuC [Chlamydiales bacterium]|nr:DNA recombination protein RmuC [Chlamydiales bacterium]
MALELVILLLVSLVVFLFYRESRLKQQIQTLKENNIQLQMGLQQEVAKLEYEKKLHVEKIQVFQEARQKLSENFESISLNALAKNTEQFLHLAKQSFDGLHQVSKGELDQRKESIEHLVKPLKESLTKLDTEIIKLEKERKGESESLKEQIKTLSSVEKELQKETANLIKALRLPDVRGRWGEVQLKRVVEIAGMINYCDFFEQTSFSHEGDLHRPDMIIKLPGNREIIIDAKTPFAAFLEASQEVDEEKRLELMQTHAKQLRAHITSLGKKSYWSLLERTPEFVILFLPAETFFYAALQADPSILELATKENVVMATPSSLIGLLKTIAYSWKEFKISEGYKEVASLGHELYKRLSDMTKHFSSLGKSLNSSVDYFNKAMGSLESRVLISARKFKELGAAPEEISIETVEMIDKKTRELALDVKQDKEEIIF